MSVTTEDHNPQPNRAATSMISLLVQTLKPFLRLASLTAIALAFLYVIWGLYLAGEPIFAVVAFALGISIVILFGWARFLYLAICVPRRCGHRSLHRVAGALHVWHWLHQL